MRRLLHAIPVMVLVAVFAALAQAAQPELEGTYLAIGANSDGSRYEVLVHIAKHGQSFVVVTMVPDTTGEGEGGPPRLASIGIGILNGDVLAVSDYSQDKARVVSYRMEDGGRRLAGRWTAVDGDGTVHEETLTKLSRTSNPHEMPIARPDLLR